MDPCRRCGRTISQLREAFAEIRRTFERPFAACYWYALDPDTPCLFDTAEAELLEEDPTRARARQLEID